MPTQRRRYVALLILSTLALLLAGLVWKWHDTRQALWRFVSLSCVPAAQSGAGTGKCAEVSLAPGLESGHVVFKDRNGPLQYLLMPTRRVSGVEDDFLLRPEAPPYWAEAWRARRWMAVSHGAPVPREVVSIAVNPKWARSQEQLHLHVSCVRPDLRAFLQALPAARSEAWSAIPGGWLGHPYEVRRIVADDLDGHDLFKDVARQHAGAMDRQGLAAIATRFDGRDGFWLLRTEPAWPRLWRGAIEGDVQDHACSELRPKA
jgi:CDP-diacylglycerol pyrophosphatase